MNDAYPIPRPRSADELRRHGPNVAEAAVRVHAETVAAGLAEQKDRWRKGFTRRRVLAGAGAVGCAALGTQLVTTKMAFAAAETNTGSAEVDRQRDAPLRRRHEPAMGRDRAGAARDSW